MKKRLLSILLTVCMVLTLLPTITSPAMAVGEGTGDPANGAFALNTSGVNIITNADQLAYVAYQINNNIPDWKTASYKIINNIDLSSYPNWEPIGIGGADVNWPEFKGTFDGGGYTISNLKQNREDGDFGLFGSISNWQAPGVVRNIALTNVVITATNINSNTAIGAIAGYNKGTIENCSVAGTISATSNVGNVWVGGITGRHWTTVRNCYSTANVSVTGKSGDCSGGIVGQTLAGSTDNCYFTGSVSGSNVKVGAIVGENLGATASNCYWLSGSASVGIEGGGSATNISSFIGTDALASQVTIGGTSYSSLLGALNARVNEVASTNLRTWTSSGSYPVLSTAWTPPTYTATVTVQKNGTAWTEVSNDNVVLSTSDTGAATNQNTGAASNGVISFGGLDGATTYYVWAKNNAGTYVNTGSVSFLNTSATVNYYDVNLTKGTGIESVTGGGTYLSGETATVSATLTDGYTWDKWSDNNTTMTSRSITVSAKTDLIASAILTPATAPSLSVTGANLIYGYTSGSVSVIATPAAGHTITGYQWYKSSTNSNTGGTLINGANSASYALTTGKAVGAEYYYCEVTSKRTDSGQTATATSGVATVTIGKANGSVSVSIAGWTYGGTASSPVPVSDTNGTSNVTYRYIGTGYDSATVPTNAGTYEVTAKFATNASYNECTATATFTIAPQPVTKPTADTTSFVYTGSEQTYTLTENTLYTITGNKRTNAGQQTVTVALKDKSNYVWATSNDTTDLNFTFTIAKAPVSFAVSGSTHNYDKAAHTATVTQTASQTPSVAGLFTVTYQKDTEPAAENETNVGVYKIIVTLSDDNFKFSGQDDTVHSLSLTDKLTINAVAYPSADNIPLPTADSLTYGAKLSDSTLIGGDPGCTYAWKTGTTIPTVTNTGYAVICTPKDVNYAPFEKTVSIDVSKATPTLTLPAASQIAYGQKLSDSTFTGGSASAAYNGVAKTNVPGVYSWSVGTTAPKVSDSESTQYEVTFTPSDTANYSTATGKITLPVNPKPVTLTWDSATPFTYDGTVKTVTAAVSNKVDEGDTFNLTYSNNSKTNAGSYTAVVTALGNSNYTTAAANVSKDWVIAKAPISFTVSDNSYTYDAAAHTATVAQTASQTPVIATDKYAVTYKLPADGSGTADKADVGVYDVIVTLSDDNFCFAGESNAATRSHKVGTLTIKQNTVTALWKNTTTVYDGSEKSPVLELVGLQSGDTTVKAQLKETKTNAGTYTVTAELSGANSGNYTLTNPTGAFVIQKAPVSFTLTGNSVKKGESVNVTATPSVAGVSDTLTYLQNGKQVVAPTETGSYDVYAEITNPNYRHAGGTDGTAQKIGVLIIYESSIPATYTVSFDANGGTGVTVSMNAVQAGTVRILSESGFTSTGKTFAGWQYNGKTYQPGECFTQPSSNVTLKALWNDKAYAIGGTVLEGDPAANAANVVVTLMLGSRQIGQTVTGVDGKYSFADVVPGVYNLAANKDGVTQTVLVIIEDKAVTNQTITMPTGKLNSVVEVKAGSPAIVVGDLEKAFSQQDKTDAATKTVELKLTAGVKAADSANNAQKEIAEKAGSVDLFLDFTLTKTVDGTPSTLNSSPVLLAAVITLPAELQGKDSYTVYRYHGTEVQTLTTTANTDGEKIEVSKDKTTLTVYTKNFSAYAIKGVTYSGGGRGGSVSSYKLTFEVNGGSAITALSETSGTTVDLSAYKPTRGGYTFAGWYSDAKLTTAITSVKLTADTTVFAKWTVKGAMPFTDVPADAYYYDAIRWALDKGVTSGITATTFNPGGICTRAQTVTFLWRAVGSPEPTTTNCPFTDVTKGTYYYNAVLWATEKGITVGTSTTTFSPEDTVTRGQTVTLLWRTAGKFTVTATNPFGDVNVDDYYANAVLWAVSKDITTGTSTTTFSPADGCTRAQIVTFLYRYLVK